MPTHLKRVRAYIDSLSSRSPVSTRSPTAKRTSVTVASPDAHAVSERAATTASASTEYRRILAAVLR